MRGLGHARGLTRPCRSPRFRCRNPDRECAAGSWRRRAPGGAIPGGRRGKACGRCPCGLFLAAERQDRTGQLVAGIKSYLVAGIHVNASPVAVVETAIFRVILRNSDCQPVRTAGQREKALVIALCSVVVAETAWASLLLSCSLCLTPSLALSFPQLSLALSHISLPLRKGQGERARRRCCVT